MTTLNHKPTKNSDNKPGWRDFLAPLLFLLFTFLAVSMASFLALYVIDRDKIPEGIRARAQADYGPDGRLEIAPVDFERISSEIEADERSLAPPQVTPQAASVIVANLPRITPVLPSATPTPIPAVTIAPTVPPAAAQPTEAAAPSTATPQPTDAVDDNRPPPAGPSATTQPPAPTPTSAASTTPTSAASTTPTVEATVTATPTPLPTSTATSVASIPGTPTTTATVTASPTVTNTPAPENSPPTTGNDTVTLSENGSTLIDVLDNDIDTDGALNPASLAIVTAPDHGTATVVSGQISYTPNPGYVGFDSLTYRVCDIEGACSVGAVSIIVTNSPDPPSASNDTAATMEDTAVTINPLTNDTDPDGDLLTISSVSAPAHGTVQNNGSSLVYTPTLNYFGQDGFTYVVSDGSLTDTAAITITISPVNDAPVARDDTAITAEDTSEDIPVRSNDSDAEGDPLTVVAVSQPANGATTTNGATVVYTPTLNFDGSDVFTYTLSDGVLTDTATVTVTMIAINDRPVAAADSYTTTRNTQLTVTAPGILQNDTDPDGDLLTAVKIADPANGTLLLAATGSFTYTPATSFTGTDSFTYRAFDGAANSATTTVTITVN